MATVVWNLDRLTGYYITVSCGFMRGRRVKRKKKKVVWQKYMMNKRNLSRRLYMFNNMFVLVELNLKEELRCLHQLSALLTES